MSTVKEFEIEDVKSEVSFAHKTLKREMDGLRSFLYDWGFWNDTYYFLQGKNKDSYIYNNLTKDFLLKLPNRCIAYINKDGKIFYSVYIDHEMQKLSTMPKEITDFIIKNSAQLKNKVGLVVFGSKIYFVGAQEVLKNDFTGPSTGLFFVMRDYKPGLFENKRPNQLSMNLIPTPAEETLKELEVGEKEIIVNEKISDILDNKTITNVAKLERSMSLNTIKMLKKLYALMVLFSIILSLGVLFIVNKLLVLQQKLFHTNRLASIGILGAGIAHELNNPLAIVSGFAQNIEHEITSKKIDNKEIQESLHKIFIHINRMKQIVDQIRIFSRGSNKNSHELKQEDINSVINDSVVLLRRQLEVHGINLSLQLKTQLPYVSVDRAKIESVIQNIVTNAKDELDQISSNKEKYIKIRSDITDGGKFVSVSISDNGGGIPVEMHKHIFDPFYTTKEPGKGTAGLGLSIAYGVMAEIKGTIKLESEVNKGTTFTLKFPVNKK